MLASIGNALTSVLAWIGQVVGSVTTEAGVLKELLPIFGIGIAVTVVMLGIRVLRGFTWGN